MIEYKSREVFKQLIYIITISMAVIGVLFIPQIIFSRVKLSKTSENECIDIAKTNLVSNLNSTTIPKTSSRNGEDVRSSDNNAETVTEKQEQNEESKVEVKAETKKEVKKESKVIETKKKAESSKKSNTVKKNSQKKVTKKEAKKVEKKEENDSKNTAKAEQEKKSSKNDTKKTTEKKDSSKNETTTKKESKKSTTKTVSISQVKISINMNLTKRTGLSRKDFIKLMSGVKADTSGFFEKNAGKIYDLCEKYSINEIFFCGLISAESGWNIASNHRRTHNYISLMRNGKLISYGSVNEGLEVAAQKLHYNYLTPGGKFYHGKTLAGVKKCFCPSSSWVGLVYGRMKQIL